MSAYSFFVTECSSVDLYPIKRSNQCDPDFKSKKFI